MKNKPLYNCWRLGAFTIIASLALTSQGAARSLDLTDIKLQTQNYAVLDLSSTVQGGNNIDLISLDDDGKVAFGFGTGSHSEYAGIGDLNDDPFLIPFDQYHVYTWNNGVLGTDHTTSCLEFWGDLPPETILPDPVPPEGSLSILRFPHVLSSDGKLFGDQYYVGTYDGSTIAGAPFWGEGDQGYGNPSVDYLNDCIFESDNGTITNFGLTGGSYIDGSDSGCGVFAGSSSGSLLGAHALHVSGGALASGEFVIKRDGGTYTVFDLAQYNVPSNMSLVNDWVSLWAVNNKASAIGEHDLPDNTEAALWDGSGFQRIGPSSDTPMDLNDQDQVVVQHTPEGYFWDNGISTTLQDQLPTLVAGQYVHTKPFSISNQVAPGAPPLASLDQSFSILADTESNNSQVKTLWKRDNSGKWSTFTVHVPDGVSVSDWTTMNKSGIIGALGKPNLVAAKDHALLLLPATFDFVYPNGKILTDKASGDGGYIPVKRLDSTPVAKLRIRKSDGLASLGGKFRLKFDGGDRYKIFKDADRTDEVISEQTEFDPTVDKDLYFEGEKKSLDRGGEEIDLQLNVNNQWFAGDVIKATVVEAEFQIQVKAFIPYAWTEPEPGPLVTIAMYGSENVVKGDNRGFVNQYSDVSSNYSADSFRLMQKVTLTPYSEFGDTADIQQERLAQAAVESSIYNKATSVNPSELTLHYGYIPLVGSPVESDPAHFRGDSYTDVYRFGRKSQITIDASAADGAMRGWGRVGQDIHWNITLTINASDPLNPYLACFGNHDRYPAYEIIVVNSEGDFENALQDSPAAGDLPGPTSLSDSNAKRIKKTYKIKK